MNSKELNDAGRTQPPTTIAVNHKRPIRFRVLCPLALARAVAAEISACFRIAQQENPVLRIYAAGIPCFLLTASLFNAVIHYCTCDRFLFFHAERAVQERSVQPFPQAARFPGHICLNRIVLFAIKPAFADHQCLIPPHLQHQPFDRLPPFSASLSCS